MGVMIAQYGPAYSMLGMVLAYESISCFSLRNSGWYLAPLLLACIPTDIHIGIRLLVCLFLGLIYFQQNCQYHHNSGYPKIVFPNLFCHNVYSVPFIRRPVAPTLNITIK